jgi:Nif-specific regulatory protein
MTTIVNADPPKDTVVSPAIQRREAALDWREQETLLMREVMKLIGRSLAPEVVFREMLHLMSELLGLNRGRIVLADRTAGGAAVSGTVHYAYGLTRAEMARGQYAAGEGITGRVLASGGAMIIQDIDAEPAFLGRMVERRHLPQETVAYIAVPITGGRQTIGVLGCHRIRSRVRSLDADLSMLRILATIAGQILQLADDVEKRTSALEARNRLLEKSVTHASQRFGIVGDAPSLLHAFTQCERVASTSATVLLLGASGTGKELFARALHELSARSTKPFIKVNCAAIPESLFESELFGHERGAFTGAHDARAGWFERADGGTIFLDEVGEVPIGVQAKLLRALQESIVVRLGGKRETHIDVRVVAATHRDLDQGIVDGTFRADLFYRLNVIPIRLPTLAERRSDIGMLAVHSATRAAQTHRRAVHLSPAAIARLEAHDWPGNIRELGNVVERLVLLSAGPVVTADEVDAVLAPSSTARVRAAAPKATEAATPDAARPPLIRDYRSHQSHERAALLDALARAGGNKSRAAQALDLTARQFAYRLQKLGIIERAGDKAIDE